MSRPSEGMKKSIETDEINHVFVEFADINGLCRTKQVTSEYFLQNWETGFPMNMLLLVQTPKNIVPSSSGYGAEIDFADGMVVPEPATYRTLPWRDDAAKVHCEFRYQGTPVGGSPRVVLREVLSDLDAKFPQLDFYAGCELEFYLLSGDTDSYEPATSANYEGVAWATESIAPFYDKLAEWAPNYGIDLHSLQHEHAPGQLEITFDYDFALDQADMAFDFRRLVKQTALITDYQATFMPKPFTEKEGSGYHLHISAFEDENNVFAPDGAASGLSSLGRYFVGGVLEHADALAALSTPNPNAFKRYDPEGFAPYAAAWGLDNRMAAIRVPSGVPRVENRIPSADANPYIVIAATLAAGADGMERELDPGDPWEGNPADSAPDLPQSLPLALESLREDRTMCESLGEEFINAYTASKRAEFEAYRQTVTSWERDQYVEPL